MFRIPVSFILIALLVLSTMPLPAAEQTVAQQVERLSVGRKIKVELKSGEVLKGLRGSATADQVVLEPRKGGQGNARTIRFEEARAVKADGMTTGQKWGTFFAIWIGLGIVTATTVNR